MQWFESSWILNMYEYIAGGGGERETLNMLYNILPINDPLVYQTLVQKFSGSENIRNTAFTHFNLHSSL